MGKKLARTGRWLERIVALPGTLADIRAWGGWLSKAWAWAFVAFPAPALYLRNWALENLVNVLYVAGCFAVSAYGIRMLRAQRAQTRRKDPVSRFRDLAPRIRKVRDIWHSRDPGAGLRFISEVVSLTPHLETLEIPCPPEPPVVDQTADWVDFLDRTLPLAELGRLEDARLLLRSRT